jgi:hypothetical protein
MPAPFHELVDTFDRTSADTTKWTPFSTNTTVAQNGGILTFVTTTLAGYAGLTGGTLYDLTGSSCVMRVINAGNQSLTSLEVVPMSLALDANNRLFWYINSNSITAYKKVAGVQSSVSSAAYNSTNHQWFRLRESGGTTYFDTSANGYDWTNFTSLANPFALTPLNIEPSVGVYAVEASGTTVTMDNFNLPPSIKMAGYRNIKVGNGMGRSEGAT